MASQYRDKPTVTFRPSDPARSILNGYTEKFETHKGKILSLMIDFIISNYKTDFEKYMEQNIKYLNPYAILNSHKPAD